MEQSPITCTGQAKGATFSALLKSDFEKDPEQFLDKQACSKLFVLSNCFKKEAIAS
jgi:hypothetical protein